MIIEEKGFQGYLKERAADCNKILYKYFERQTDENTRLFEAVNYSVRSGGKRLRMIMLLEAATMSGGGAEAAAPFAAALEMIHTYSLIHDDLPAMDNSDTRRGQPSCHKQFNDCLAVLAGDGLLSYAFELMSGEAWRSGDLRSVRAMNIIAKKAGLFGMVYGQALDTENAHPSAFVKEKIDANKTAAMFEAAMLAGAVLADAPEGAVAAAGEFGRLFGLAFQIADDVKDCDAPPQKIEEAAQLAARAKAQIQKYDKRGFFAALCDFLFTE